jgi:hypothetical protein
MANQIAPLVKAVRPIAALGSSRGRPSHCNEGLNPTALDHLFHLPRRFEGRYSGAIVPFWGTWICVHRGGRDWRATIKLSAS